ncbi:MAG: hypothetical protein CL846_03360 [Crocinitomicaceae bacterium]|nr:hypothetical protein [Crocinitomicaceae bacterium]
MKTLFISKAGILLSSLVFIILNAILLVNEFYFLLPFPILLFILYLGVFRLDTLLLLIVFCTPLSFNFEDLSIGGIGFYFPTEPLLFILMLIFIGKSILKNDWSKHSPHLLHPISIIIFFQLLWILITSISSEYPLVSFKFFLSRSWFVVPVYFFSILIFKKNLEKVYQFLLAFVIPLYFVLLITLFKHASMGFSEEAGHWVMWPFFKDHTSYGAIIALFIPIILGLITYYKNSFTVKFFLRAALVIFLIALYFSYTRAAWLSVVGALCVYILFYFKISFKWIVLLLSGVAIALLINSTELEYLLQKNNAEHTTENFSERLESMSNISSDASNLERLNRWNCAIKLFKERPILGWGPGTYSFVYAPYQDASDLTIISTNFGDGGNAHSEYLGPLAEQGILGMILMILMLIFFFYRASWLYIKTESQKLKGIIMMIILSLVTYFSHGVLNNYLDTDKASVPIWGMLAIFVAVDCYHSKTKTS